MRAPSDRPAARRSPRRRDHWCRRRRRPQEGAARALCRVAVGAALALSTAPAAGAQGPVADRLRVGARVRVDAPPERRLVGVLAAVGPDTLCVVTGAGGEPRRIARVDVARLEVSVGRRPRLGRGALLGLATGYAVGAAVGFVAFDLSQPEDSNLKGIGMLLGSWWGAVGGTAVGLIAGAWPVEAWRRVPAR